MNGPPHAPSARAIPASAIIAVMAAGLLVAALILIRFSAAEPVERDESAVRIVPACGRTAIDPLKPKATVPPAAQELTPAMVDGELVAGGRGSSRAVLSLNGVRREVGIGDEVALGVRLTDVSEATATLVAVDGTTNYLPLAGVTRRDEPEIESTNSARCTDPEC